MVFMLHRSIGITDHKVQAHPEISLLWIFPFQYSLSKVNTIKHNASSSNRIDAYQKKIGQINGEYRNTSMIIPIGIKSVEKQFNIFHQMKLIKMKSPI